MEKGNNYRQVAVPVTTTEDIAIDANPKRVALILFNTGAVDMTFGIKGALITIKANDHAAFLVKPPINAITCKTATGSTTLVVWEA